MRLKICENLRTTSLNPKFTILIKQSRIGKTSGFPGFTMRPTIILLNECIGVARIFDWGEPQTTNHMQ